MKVIKTKKYLVPIWGEVSFTIEVESTSEEGAVEKAYDKVCERDFKGDKEEDFDVYWDYDRMIDSVGEIECEEVDE